MRRARCGRAASLQTLGDGKQRWETKGERTNNEFQDSNLANQFSRCNFLSAERPDSPESPAKRLLLRAAHERPSIKQVGAMRVAGARERGKVAPFKVHNQ